MQAAIEVTKVAIMVVREAETLVNNARSIQTMQGMDGPMLKQLM